MILRHKNQSGHKRTKDLCKYIVRNLLPWEALPDGKTDCDGRMEVAARYRAEDDDGEDDTDGIGPADLEERTEGRIGVVNEEGGSGSNAGIAIIPLIFLRNRVTEVGHTRRRKHPRLRQPSHGTSEDACAQSPASSGRLAEGTQHDG
jgi:hypothetical protein